jgi:hypothetical protein
VSSYTNHLVVTLFITDRIRAKTLLDTDVSSLFILFNFLRIHNLSKIKLALTKTMRIADGSPVKISEAVNLT